MIVHVRSTTARLDRRIGRAQAPTTTRCGAPVTAYDVEPSDVRSASAAEYLRDWLSQRSEPRDLCTTCCPRREEPS